MNEVYEAIEDAIIASLEEGPWLPYEFELTLEDAPFQELLKGLVMAGTSKKVDPKLKCVSLRIQERNVTVRSDRDPESWAPISREEALH